MKLSNDQKRMLKLNCLGIVTYPAFYTLSDWLFSKQFSWDAVLTGFVAGLGLFLVGVLLIIGSAVPKKDDGEKQGGKE